VIYQPCAFSSLIVINGSKAVLCTGQHIPHTPAMIFILRYSHVIPCYSLLLHLVHARTLQQTTPLVCVL